MDDTFVEDEPDAEQIIVCSVCNKVVSEVIIIAFSPICDDCLEKILA